MLRFQIWPTALFILNLFHLNLSQLSFQKEQSQRVSRSVCLPSNITYVSQRFRTIFPVVPLIDHISLIKSKEEILKFSNSSIDDGSSRHQWLGEKKVNSHQAPLLITDKGPNLGLDLCQWTSKAVTLLNQFC